MLDDSSCVLIHGPSRTTSRWSKTRWTAEAVPGTSLRSQMLAHVLGAGGKRLRPAIALLAGKFGDYDRDLLVPLAASIELLHTATLVHDDVIDASATRRGRATANSRFNNAAAVMLGDYMFAHAAEADLPDRQHRGRAAVRAHADGHGVAASCTRT